MAQNAEDVGGFISVGNAVVLLDDPPSTPNILLAATMPTIMKMLGMLHQHAIVFCFLVHA